MKRFKVCSIAAGVLMLGATAAQAVYFPPTGPLYIQFSNVEQISPTGQILTPSGATESNWGVFKVSVIQKGNTVSDPQNFTAGPLLWADGQGGAEITGMFWGATPSPNQTALNATGGHISLYYDSTPDADLGAATPSMRTGDNTFTNFTDGDLLMQLNFVNGAIIFGDPNTSITGTATPNGVGFVGVASSYGNVDLSVGGAWTNIFDGNYFNTMLGPNTADVAFRNIYQNNLTTGTHPWDAVSPIDGSPIYGAQSSDPARANVVPEPSTFLLLGMGLMGCGFIARRRKG